MTEVLGMTRCVLIAVSLIAVSHGRVVAEDDALLPPGDETPILRFSTGGPTGYLTGLAWTPDESVLYGTSWDKRVHAWSRVAAEGDYRYDPAKTLRVPIGGGFDGALSTLDISADGDWLATAGRGLSRKDTGTRNEGWVVSQVNLLDDQDRQDRGLIYVFNLRERKLHLLRGHRGEVRVLKFVRGLKGPLKLVSLADERSDSGVFSVLRLWDVTDERQIAELAALPRSLSQDGKIPVVVGRNPKLAAWMAAEDQQLRAVLAMDQFPVPLVWTPMHPVEGQRVQGRGKSNSELNLLSVAEGSSGILAGRQGELAIWDLKASAAAARFPLKPNQLVRGIAWHPRSGNGSSLAAVLVMSVMPGQTFQYHLLTVEAAANAPRLKIVGKREGQPIYAGDSRELALAAGVSRVAVAGMPGEAIQVFEWDQLKAGGAAGPRVLTTRSRRALSAAFVKSADEPSHWGIALHPELEPVKSAAWLQHPRLRVFDAADRRFTSPQSWTLSQPDRGGWVVSSLEEARGTGVFTVRTEAGGPIKIDVNQWERPGRRHQVTASVFCPPTLERSVPLLIVASHLHGEIFLRGFRADTGAELFWFTGHIGFIRDLAVSGDGRLLLSLAEDRTVCLWSLTRLDEVIDRGSPGNLVATEDAAEEVLTVRDPGQSKLKPGDVLVGLEADGEHRALTTYRQLHREFRRETPGGLLTLEVRRGGQVLQVPVEVTQAVRERKPLCTLLISEIAGEQPAWAAWHPSGRFDSSGPDAERLLGWHFNTGDRNEPTRFVSMDQYRERFFRSGLLPRLIDAADLPAELDEVPLPNLSLTLLRVDDAGETVLERDEAGLYRLQSSSMRVIVHPDSDVPVQQLASMRWYWGDETQDPRSGEFTWDDYGCWIADIDKIPLDRQETSVRVELRTTGAFPRVVAVQGQILTSPPPPMVAVSVLPDGLAIPAEGLVTEQDAVQVQVQADGHESAQLTVSLRRGDAVGATQTKLVAPKKPATFSLDLKPGDQELVVKAVNANAVPLTERDETSIVSHVIRRTEADLEIQIASVQAINDPEQRNLLQAGTTAVTTFFPQVRITGMIRAGALIKTIDFQYDNTERREQPETKEYRFSETVDLNSGEHAWKVTAASGEKMVSRLVTIDYRPRLPKVTNIRFQELLEPGRRLPEKRKLAESSLYQGWHQPKLRVTADLEPPGDAEQLPADYRIEFVANGDVHAAPDAAVDRTDPRKHRLSGEVPLAAGFNRLALVVRNSSGGEPFSERYDVRYRRPPVVTECNLEMNQEVDGPIAVTGIIESTPELEQVVIDVNGVTQPATFQKLPDSEHQWKFETAELSLPAQATVTIHAENADSGSLEEFSRQVTVRKPVSRSEVEIILPGTLTATTSSPELSLDLEFRSPRQPIRAIEVFDAAGRKVADAGRLLEQQEFPRTFSWRTVLTLEEGPDNQFEIRAYDGLGGEPARERIAISYVPAAGGLKIISFDGKEAVLTSRGWQLKQGARVNASPAKLRGRLELAATQDPSKPVSIKAVVNGIHRRTVSLSRQNNWAFELDLILNWKKENHIELQVLGADLPSDVRTLYAGCEQPEQDQELFLFLISPNERALKQQVFESLNIQENAQGELEAPAAGFKTVHCLDGCDLTGDDAVAHKVLGNLDKVVKAEIKNRRVKNPVVLIFYHGKDFVRSDGSLLLATARDFDNFTGRTSGSPENQLTDRNLERRARSIRAGNLLFVEVAERKPNRNVWRQPSEMAVFRRTISERQSYPLLADLNPVLPKVAKLESVQRLLGEIWQESVPRAELSSADAVPIFVPEFMRYLPFGGGNE